VSLGEWFLKFQRSSSPKILLGLLDPEYGGITILQNVWNATDQGVAPHPSRFESSTTLL